MTWHDDPPCIPLGTAGWEVVESARVLDDWLHKSAIDRQNMTIAMVKAAEAHAVVAMLLPRVRLLEKKRRKK